jgi:hypothetical protein
MFVPVPQMQAAEMRRREFVAQGLHEQWIDQVLATSRAVHTVQPPALATCSSTLQRAANSIRDPLTSLRMGTLMVARS